MMMKHKLQRIMFTLFATLAGPIFFLGLHVAIAPTGHLVMAFSSRSLLFAGMGLLLTFIPLGLTGIAYLMDRHINVAEQVQTVAAPLLLLYAYPLAIILHPLGTPRQLLVLFQPRIILFFSISIMGLIFVKTTMTPLLSFIRGRLMKTSATLLAWLIFMLFCCIYVFMIFQNDRVHRLVGDEPHYLMIMESLRRYQTADLLPLVESDAPLPHGIRIVNLHTSGQTRPGTRYEVHNIGTAIAMLPAFHLFGYRAAVGIFALFTAFLIANLYVLCEETTNERMLGLCIATIAGFSAPFFFYFRFIYPEIPATACALFSFRILRKHAPTNTLLFIAGAAAAALPWFHVKFTLIAATLMLMTLWLHRKSWKRMCLYAIPFLPSALLLMRFFYMAYGSWLPNAQYGGAYQTINAFFFRGSLGLLLDPDNGLIPFAPFYSLAFPGMIALWTKNRAYCFQALLLTIPSFIIVSSHWMWWGGPCPPARFIIPFIPFYIPGLVIAIKSAQRTPALRLLCLLLILATLAISYVSLGHVNNLHVPSHFLRGQFLSIDAHSMFPSFYIHRSQPVPRDRFITAAVWLLLFLAPALGFRGPAKKAKQVTRTARFLPFVLFLAVPGAVELIDAGLAQRTIHVRNAAELSLAQLNHVLDTLYRPLARSRTALTDLRARELITPITLNVQIPIETEFALPEDLFEPGHPRRWLYSRPYTTVFPASYVVTLDVTAAPIAFDQPALYFDVNTHNQRMEYMRQDLFVDPDSRKLIQNEFLVEPKDILPRSKFRIAALQPGDYKLRRIQIAVTLP